MAVVLEDAVVCAEEGDGEVKLAEVILAAEQVGADKVTGEALTEPVAAFGHDEPVAPAVAADFPGVELTVGLDCPLRGEPELCADVGREERIVQDVGLDSRFLPTGVETAEQTEHNE